MFFLFYIFLFNYPNSVQTVKTTLCNVGFSAALPQRYEYIIVRLRYAYFYVEHNPSGTSLPIVTLSFLYFTLSLLYPISILPYRYCILSLFYPIVIVSYLYFTLSLLYPIIPIATLPYRYIPHPYFTLSLLYPILTLLDLCFTRSLL